jgi:hypothetical protein
MEFKHTTRVYKNVDEDGNKLKPYIINYTVFLREGKVVGVNSILNYGTNREYPTSVSERTEVFEYFRGVFE